VRIAERRWTAESVNCSVPSAGFIIIAVNPDLISLPAKKQRDTKSVDGADVFADKF